MRAKNVRKVVARNFRLATVACENMSRQNDRGQAENARNFRLAAVAGDNVLRQQKTCVHVFASAELALKS